MIIPCTPESYQLLHEGSIALAEVEANGIRIDEAYLHTTIRRTKRRIKHLEAGIQGSEVVKEWRKFYGAKTNLNSTDQLGHVLFDRMGFTCTARTATLKYSTDEKALSGVDHPFVRDYLLLKKLQKTLTTYLRGIQREVVDGYIHPSYSLNRVVSYRSSSSDPNFQNIPIRNPEVAKLIRTALLPRPGGHLVEIDYSGIEVAIACCYHQDPTMHSYLRDKTKDMHRDVAMECYKLSLEELTPADVNNREEVKRAKDLRYCGKNLFTFPQFYGDWYIACAQNLWEACDTMKLRTRNGRPLREHLASQGFTELGDLNPKEEPRKGTFEEHVKRVQENFWGVRFPVYAQWKRDWVAAYRHQGWMLTKTGFVCQGYSQRNEIVNYPIQGSAFHCLLWSLIQLVRRELKRAKMKALVVGQIHDSLVNDVPHEELGDFLGLVREITVNRLHQHWDWINVPLEVEAEVAPLEGSWYEKKKHDFK